MSASSRDDVPRPPWVRRRLSVGVYHARRTMARLDNAEVRGARQLLTRLRTDPPDVLYLGDSALSFVSPADEDKRRLYTMVGDALGPDVSMHVLHGGSYHPALYTQYLRLAATTGARPLVIVPICVRVRTLPWIEHPIFGHKQATAFLHGLGPHVTPRQVRAGFPRPTPADFSSFHRLPHHTWAGELTVGDYIRRLKDPATHGLDERGRLKLLYAYHHGGLVPDEGEHIEAMTRMGRMLRELGCAVVAYQTPVPVQKGSELHGAQFAELATRNFAVLDAAYRAGLGADAEILQTGTVFGTEEFIDPRDGSEHLNQVGRDRLSEQIVAAVTRLLPSRRGSTELDEALTNTDA
ncbi:MAG: hypothetical protein JWO57_3122 [Pseudonocardiales bacterium]|nr:hypothetical protein [Pseudonocardiales bacterium]